MRWKKNKVGDFRIVRRFLLFPRTINYETRWLEFATIKQQWYRDYCDDLYWIDYNWENE